VGGLAERVRDRLADADAGTSVAATLRARRWRLFLELNPDLDHMRVLDLGGTAAYWRAAPCRPDHVTLVNLSDQSTDEGWIDATVGDVCSLPASLRHETFDLIYSNSVIEHVGGHVRREEMAGAINSMATRHWVQTPYRYFPVEPHWLFPGFQFLPTSARARVAKSWPLMWSRPPDRRAAVSNALGVELLDRTQFAFYFPESRMLDERVAGLTKSLIAVR
jgi:hypothetical protein